jgi:multisubunit Na+/H+ antiporter MnhG subunit
LLLIFFVLAASPAVSHAISSAAYRAGITPIGKRDDLKEKLSHE